MPIKGFRDLQNQLRKMSAANGGKALRSAAMKSMLPAVKAARAAAPKGNPPYFDTGSSKLVDPYPKKTHKGRFVTPGFASRSIARRSRISRDKRQVRVDLGVKPEAFYAVQFIEFGTSKIPAQPWLEPAFRGALGSIDRTFRRELQKNIDKVIR